MKKGMNLIERVSFCIRSAVLEKNDEETIETLQALRSDSSILSFGKTQISDWATAALIYLKIINYEDNVSENTDYFLHVYSEFAKEYKNGTLEL